MFPQTYLLPLQASPTGNVRSEAANPVVSRPGRLRASEIPKPLSMSLMMTPPRHHQPALPSKIGELPQNWYWCWQKKLAQLLYLRISPFCIRFQGLVLNLKVPPTEWNYWHFPEFFGENFGDSPIKLDMKLGPQTHFGAQSQSEGTIQLVPKQSIMLAPTWNSHAVVLTCSSMKWSRSSPL